MTQERSPANSRVSRRDFLHVAAIGGGAILGSTLFASPARAKMAQKAMQYRPTPNGNQRCDNCANFQAPGSCKLVDGPVAPTGWCMLYVAKK